MKWFHYYGCRNNKKVLNYAPGSEIIVTAINIPDMITVIRHHGLIPVPVHVEVSKLSSSLDDIKKAYTSKVAFNSIKKD